MYTKSLTRVYTNSVVLKFRRYTFLILLHYRIPKKSNFRWARVSIRRNALTSTIHLPAVCVLFQQTIQHLIPDSPRTTATATPPPVADTPVARHINIPEASSGRESEERQLFLAQRDHFFDTVIYH